jgi:exopolyphosphatase / guanosine-5'-triphosphate,3'-diphosphate pyrophosphatase
MRLGVLDIGSNTVHLQVVDAHPGARPNPTTNQKVELQLHEFIDKSGMVTEEGVTLLNTAIDDAVAHAKEFETEEILAFATSAIRDAKNGKEILKALSEKHGIELQVLSGEEEAAITFLAVRRWLGWSSGRLIVLDIGGGSLEIAVGNDEAPELTASLPLGASRLTRDFLDGDPYKEKDVKELESHVRDGLKDAVSKDLLQHGADHFVATSKTFRTLARLGSHWFEDNPKYLKLASLEKIVIKLADMTNKQRAELPGVSETRAKQILSGAIVARSVMTRLEITQLEICPWALREGIVLKWLDWMER